MMLARLCPPLAALLLGASLVHADPNTWPTRGWPASTPEAQGLRRDALEALDREFASGKHGYVDAMLVIRHGQIVFERSYAHDYDRLFTGRGAPGLYNYYDPEWHPYFNRTDFHTMQSVTKSVTSALVGIAIARGEVPGVEARLLSFLGGFRHDADPRRARMTLRDVLSMTTGIRWDEETVDYTDPRNNCAAMEASADWVQYVLDQPMAEEPGTRFLYNSGATQLLSQVIRTATGQQADDYAKERLFDPLGIDSRWKRTPKGLADTEGGLYLRPRDLAKIGYLYLHDGVWEERRLLPEGWVAESTRWRVDTAPKGPGYGYKWWVLSRKGEGTYDAYAADGYGGQRLIVVPALDLIGVFTGWNIYDTPALDPGFALRRLLAAVERP